MTNRPPFDHEEELAAASDPDDGMFEYDEDERFDDDDYSYEDDDLDDEDRDFVELRPESSRGRRVLTVLGVVLVVVLVAVGAAGVWVSRQVDPGGPAGEVKEIDIPEGSTSDDIGTLLAAEDIITSDFVWGWYLRINGGGPFQAGVYELATNSAMGDVVETLTEGPRPPEERSFTVPEGYTVPEIIARLADPEEGLGFDAAKVQSVLDSGQVRSEFQPADQPSNEGILFPETYRISEDADELAVLQQMVGQLDATLNELGVASAQERFNLSPYEILIVASLIEEETKVDAERPKVAQVIYNRLRQRIPLGIDATSRYEAEIAGRDREDIDFESDSPYNTRRNQGLPPTPIAAPGRASIAAALNPEEGPWTFYVLEDAEGNHFFTESNREFLAAKERCRQNGLGCG
ncbi:MAG: endolytic transglycosylase MltG [Acidimicrobiales bacterium]